MRGQVGLRLICAGLLAGLLAACLGPSSDGPRGDTGAGASPTPRPTVEKVGQFPEIQMEMTLDAAAARLSGREKVTYPNHTGVPLDEIVFRLYPNLPQYGGLLSVGRVLVEGREVAASLRAGDTALVVPLPRPLAPEKALSLELVYEVEVPHKEDGYALFGYSQGIWSLPDAYPLLAVHDGTAWHEDLAPAHGDAVVAPAAVYDVRLTLPADLVVAATGSPASTPQDTPGSRVHHLAGGPLREFAWLASADYQVSEATAQGKVLRSYYLPGDEAAGQAALNTATAALRTYQAAFGSYPYGEMAIVEAPLLHYGMELPGLNLIGLNLYREQRDQLEDRVVHEIAHQWWYAQVGNDQVNTPWLDEGLAEYSMAFYYDQVLGEARLNTLINQRWLVPYQVAVENGYDAVVNQPAAAFAWEYEVIVYAKAALFFHALHQELGDELFVAVLQRYLERYRWQMATPDDFVAVAEEVSDRDLDALYSRWILSRQ